MRFWSPFVLLALPLAAAFAEPTEAVNRTPPEAYARAIAPLLTPFASVLEGRTVMQDGESSGVILLSEKIKYRDADGVLYRLEHRIYHVLAQSGVESLSSEIFTYDKERESLFLIDAATTQPDGRRLPVEAKGAFIQTPQREAANSLYTSMAELNLIYPSVAPGVSIEAIVLVRENTAVMPGEFCLDYSFGAGWPVFRDRLVVELPDAEWKRMKQSVPLGGLDAPEESVPSPLRQRKTWTANRIPRRNWEENTCAFEFRAPTLWLTTVPDWNAFARWFHGLAATRSDLGPELTAEVDRLTAGLTAPDQIIAALHTVAANEVRYTGLEFGLAGYQPYPCAEVWHRRYGDCKDKANLLRAMLAHKGIRAHLALLSTRPLGRVEKSSPSWWQFNHVILAVENGPGGYLLCDPTIKHLPAGKLGLADLDRDVLITREDRGEWIHIPDTLDSSIRLTMDLALAGDGELSGWFTLLAQGTDAAYYADSYNTEERIGLTRTMQRTIEQFLPGAEVADIDYAPHTGDVRECRMRAYLRRPPRAAGLDTVEFPFATGWLPNLTTVGDRRQPYGAARREESLEARIVLPSGVAPGALPTAFSAPSPTTTVAAAWEFRDGALHARLHWRPEKTEIPAAEYAVFRNSMRALTAWLAQPVTLHHVEGATTASAATSAGATADALRNFPILPTGEGQIRLLNEKYPEDGDSVLRRAALERVLQWFPQDPETVFTAQVSLARLDRDKDGFKPYAERLAALRARYGDKVSVAARSWAEYLEIQARWNADKNKTALERMRRMAADERLSPFRRGWAAFEAGRYLGDNNPAAAAKFLAPFAPLECEAQPDILAETAAMLLRAGDTKTLEKLWRDQASKGGEDADSRLVKILAYFEEDWDKASVPVRDSVLEFIATTVRGNESKPATGKRFAAMKTRIVAEQAQRHLAHELGAWLKAHPPAWWTTKKNPRFADADAVIAHIKARNDAKDATGTIDAALQLVLFHDAKFTDFAMYLRWALWWMNHENRDEELFREASRLALALPVKPSTEVVETWSLLAEHRAAKADAAGARQLYERIFNTPEVEDYQRVEATGELGHLERRLGNLDAALAAYRRLEPIHTNLRKGADYLYAALLIEVGRSNFDRASELVAQMARQEQKYLDTTNNSGVIVALIRAGKDPAALSAYWHHAAEWQKAWDALASSAGVAPPKDLPLGVNWATNTEQCKKAAANRDAAAFLQLLASEVVTAGAVPLAAGNFLEHLNHCGFLPEAQRQSLYQCGRAFVAGLAPVDPEFDDMGQAWEVAFLTNSGQAAEAATKAATLHRRLGANSTGPYALRMWLQNAQTPAAQAEAATTALDLLATESLKSDRQLMAATLSDVLWTLKDRTRHLPLLEREIARTDFDRSINSGQVLLKRLELLRQEGSATAELTQYVRSWLEKPEHSWLNGLHPTSLSDPKFADHHEPMINPQKGFSSAERLKFNLLLALDEATDAQVREHAFRDVVTETALATNDHEAFTTAIFAILADKALSQNCRASLLAVTCWKLTIDRRPDLLARCTAHPLFPALNEPYRRSVTAAHKGLQLLGGAGADRRREAFAALVDPPLDSLRNFLIADLIQGALFAEDDTAVESLIASADKLTLDPELDKTASTVRMNWTRSARRARELRPFVKLLQQKIGSIPDAGREYTARARDIIDLGNYVGLTGAEQLALAHVRLHESNLVAGDIDDLLRLFSHSRLMRTPDPATGLELFDAFVALPVNDQLKSDLLPAVVALSDSDQPNVAAHLRKALDPLAAPTAAREMPQTAATAMSLRAGFALRSSREKRPDELFDSAQTKLIPTERLQRLQLRFHASRGEFGLLDSMLETVDPALVADQNLLPYIEPLLRKPGREAERKLYEQAATDALVRDIDTAWAAPQWGGIHGSVFEMGAIDGFQDLIPAAWFDYLVGQTRDELALLELQMARARIRRDWTKLREATNDYLRLVPTMYSSYYSRAIAEHALGLGDAARADLDVYLQYAMGDSEYQDAVQLRQALNVAAPQ